MIFSMKYTIWGFASDSDDEIFKNMHANKLNVYQLVDFYQSLLYFIKNRIQNKNEYLQLKCEQNFIKYSQLKEYFHLL